jgi:hypothetical protein
MTHQMTCISNIYPRLMFHCQECGRRFILDVLTGDKHVITEGDPAATHTGGTGGVTIGAVEVTEPLDPFEAWANGFDWPEE